MLKMTSLLRERERERESITSDGNGRKEPDDSWPLSSTNEMRTKVKLSVSKPFPLLLRELKKHKKRRVLKSNESKSQTMMTNLTRQEDDLLERNNGN